jgi:hypothetical protein
MSSWFLLFLVVESLQLEQDHRMFGVRPAQLSDNAIREVPASASRTAPSGRRIVAVAPSGTVYVQRQTPLSS